MNAPWSCSGSRPAVGFQEMKEQMAWLSLGANNCKPCSPPLARKPKACCKTAKNVNGKEPLETTNPILTQSTVWQNMSRPLCSGCEQDTGLRGHLKRTGIKDSAFWDWKEAEGTVHHVLQDCPIWRQQRHRLWQQDESTTIKLWGTADNLRRTIQFLATCGLRFWARLIDRRGRRQLRVSYRRSQLSPTASCQLDNVCVKHHARTHLKQDQSNTNTTP